MPRSGVGPSAPLKTAIGSGSLNGTRLIKVRIRDDELVPVETLARELSWEKDFGRIGSLLKDGEPCFVVCWMDKSSTRTVYTGAPRPSSKGKDMLVAMFVPEDSPVKEKMLYASSRSALIEAVGEGSEEYQGSSKSDFTWTAYSKLRQRDDSLLSEVERGLKDTSAFKPEEVKEATGMGIIGWATGKSLPPVVAQSIAQAASKKFDPSKVVEESTSRTTTSLKTDSSWIRMDDEMLVRPSSVNRPLER